MTDMSDDMLPMPSHQKEAALADTLLERVCVLLSALAIILMLFVIGTDIFTRTALHFSFEISDDIGGYMLVVITFLSLAICQTKNGFHHVEFLQVRLNRRGRAISRAVFDLIALVASLILLWFLISAEIQSFQSADRAPTHLATPLWLPQLAMSLGVAALCVSLFRTLAAHVRTAAAVGIDGKVAR